MNTFKQLTMLTPTLAVSLLCGLPASAQQAPKPAAPAAAPVPGPGGRVPARLYKLPEGPAPRMADGKVDFSGNWAPNAINENVDLARVLCGKETVPCGNPPLLPWAEKVYLQRKGDISKDDPESLCLPPGVPRMSTTPYPWTMVQTDKMLVIVYEGGAHVWRKIFLDGRAHNPEVVESWLGDSIGHWQDKDTLIVETVGQTDTTWLDESGLPHTKDMVVTEQFKRPDAGHMEIVHTVTDPGAYSKPWTFTTHPTILNGELIEYICQENNRDVQHLKGK
jgi:hypothetical protein